MEEDIKRLEELIKESHSCWIGISNQKALENLLKRYKELEEENKQLREDVEGYSGLAKQIQEDYENRIDELENRDRFE